MLERLQKIKQRKEKNRKEAREKKNRETFPEKKDQDIFIIISIVL